MQYRHGGSTTVRIIIELSPSSHKSRSQHLHRSHPNVDSTILLFTVIIIIIVAVIVGFTRGVTRAGDGYTRRRDGIPPGVD
jgi:hypothetical protein